MSTSRFAKLAVLAVGLGSSLSAPASAMTFRPAVIDGRPAYLALGQITIDTPQSFAALPAAPGTLVLLNSPGGNVGASVELGALFRERGVTAIVASMTPEGRRTAGACFSACVYALVGAARRVVPAASRVGIHRMSPAVADGWAMTGRVEREQHKAAADVLKDYTQEMGVDPSMIVSAERIPSHSIHVLTPRELRRWGVAND